MKLPKITQEILDNFADNFCDENGPADDPYNSQLIEWMDKKPQWTQTAVDFACLIARGEESRATDEVTLQGLLKYSTSEQVYDLGDVISFALQQNEEMTDRIVKLEAEIERVRPVMVVLIEEREHAKRSIGEYRDLSMSEKLKATIDRYTETVTPQRGGRLW